MKFLVDENLSPRLVELLLSSGFDAVHVRGCGIAGAPDTVVMARAMAEGRVIISADTDFGALLAQSRAIGPSVILVREIIDLRPPELAAMIISNIDLIEQDLGTGAITAFTGQDIRVRPLPLR
ncbi:MAG: hypothetical protein QG608_1387 [Actinomycetota bacterium]|nr:hypothetical protein [Actinomycetota bacterium]